MLAGKAALLSQVLGLGSTGYSIQALLWRVLPLSQSSTVHPVGTKELSPKENVADADSEALHPEWTCFSEEMLQHRVTGELAFPFLPRSPLPMGQSCHWPWEFPSQHPGGHISPSYPHSSNFMAHRGLERLWHETFEGARMAQSLVSWGQGKSSSLPFLRGPHGLSQVYSGLENSTQWARPLRLLLPETLPLQPQPIAS